MAASGASPGFPSHPKSDLFNRLRPVSSVLLPEWLPVPAESPGRAAHHGPDCR